MKFNQLEQYHSTFNKHLAVDRHERDVWVIGDVHGCAREFRELCHRIRLLNETAIIIQLGDLIDRGPCILEVFDVVSTYDVMCTIGNHELNFILEHEQYKRCGSKARQHTHEVLNRYYDKEAVARILRTMRSMYNAIHLDLKFADLTERWCMSHAPVKGYESSSIERGDVSKNAWTYCARTDPYDESLFGSSDYAVHGHQHWNYVDIDKQINGLLHHGKRTLNVDGGCVYGGELVAVNLNKMQSARVKAHEIYFPE